MATKEEIIKKVNSFQGANREFSQEMGPVVEEILGLVEANSEEIEKKQEAPAIAGTENQMLAIDASGKPVWVDPAAGSTVDTTMSEQSTNPVQNKVITKALSGKADTEDVEERFAHKDGYYSQLTAGSAEKLVGQTVDKDAYLIRPTATSDDATNEVANGVASVLGMEGNSTVWNQLVRNGNFVNQNYWGTASFYGSTYSVANNILTITPNNVSIGGDVKHTLATSLVVSHKYLLVFGIKGTNVGGTLSCRLSGATNQNLNNKPFNTTKGIINYIFTSEYANNAINFFFTSLPSTTSIELSNVNMFDLTLLGIDNLTEVSKVEEWLAQHVGTKPYYAYNAGTILSAQTLGIKTYGQNLLNPTTKQAKLIPYTWEENSNVYTIKNVPSANDLQITYTPDATGVAVPIDTTESIPDSIDISDYGGSGVLYISSATADTYVCMKWDEQKDDDVVPYEDHTYDFDVRKVYGKVSGAGEYVQCYPNGMRSAGSVHDTLTASEAVVKVGSVDLGELSFNHTTSSGREMFTAPLGFKVVDRAVVPNFINVRYRVVSQSSSWVDGDISQDGNVSIVIVNNNYTDASTFKTAMSGVKLDYELATPITYTDLVYRDGGIDRPLADVLMNIEVNNWSMEEQLMTPYDNGNPTSIPATISTIYGMDAVEQIDTLNKTCYFAKDVKDNLQALLTCINTNCAETLGGTFSIGDPTQEDSKVFTFTFTENTEPDVEPTNEGE